MAGVLGGHVLTYAILFPDAHVHERVLEASGHGWTALLWPAVLTGIAVAVALGLLSGTGRARSRGIRFSTLFLLQAGIFAGLEVGERLATTELSVAAIGHHLFDHGLAPILVVGSLIQVAAAWLGSAASRAVDSVAARIAAARPRRRSGHSDVIVLAETVLVTRPVRAHRSRGPPLLVGIRLPAP